MYRIDRSGFSAINSGSTSSGGSNGGKYTIPRKTGIATRIIIGITMINYMDYSLHKSLQLNESTYPLHHLQRKPLIN